MGKYIRTPKHAALMREVLGAKADARVDSDVRVMATVCDELKEGARADQFRPQNVNTNNGVKRQRRSAARAFKARRICAEFWNYDKL